MRRNTLACLLLAALAVCATLWATRSRESGKRPPTNAVQRRLVQAARDQLTWGTTYDPSYAKIAYPGGDVPHSKGVCTDVIIRAYRSAGYDLQKLVHEDKLAAPGAYRKYDVPIDANIDHRRCPNLATFFQRHGKTLSREASGSALKNWQPGDIVFWKLVGGLDHVGLVSDKVATNGEPFVVHNIGTPAEEPCLNSWKVVGHYRFPRS